MAGIGLWPARACPGPCGGGPAGPNAVVSLVLMRRVGQRLRFRSVDRTDAKIERVAVLADARGHAVGAALVKAAIEHLRERGFRTAKLHAQTYALGFYAKLGFAAFGEVFDEDGIPHKAMRLDLAAVNSMIHAPGHDQDGI